MFKLTTKTPKIINLIHSGTLSVIFKKLIFKKPKSIKGINDLGNFAASLLY